MDPALQELMAEGEPGDEVAVVLKLAPGAAPPASLRLVARFGPVATARVLREDVMRAWSASGVESLKAPHRYRPEPLPDGEEAEGGVGFDADAVEGAEAWNVDPRPGDERRPADLAVHGRGVLLAHIDWGADFAHPDFRHADGRTRFAAIWDQGAPYDPSAPNRYGYGRIHTAADIDRALAAADPYAALGYHPGRARPAGGAHGTHTLGISGGNGGAGGPSGLAPGATLAFVDLSTQRQIEGAGLGDSAALLEGLDFLAALAAQLGARQGSSDAQPGVGEPLPLVINASLGRQAGQHDGRTLTEQAMDAFVAARPGRAVVQSTGNYFNRAIHASGLLRPGEQRTLTLRIAERHPPHEVDLWYPGVDRFGASLLAPGQADGVAVVAVEERPTDIRLGDRVVGRLYHRRADPNNGDNQLVLYLDADAPGGDWTLRLDGLDVVDGRFHAWIERGPGGGAAQARFVDADDTPCCTLGTICNGWRTLAVGAVDAHDPDRALAPFSSGGPTRDGRVKPDLVAPGHHVLSASSTPLGASPGARLRRMSGTSMAAPHVAGTVALMYAAAPRALDIRTLRRLLLAATAPRPAPRDAVERWRQGNGELDVRAAVAAAQDLAPGGDTELPSVDATPPDAAAPTASPFPSRRSRGATPCGEAP